MVILPYLGIILCLLTQIMNDASDLRGIFCLKMRNLRSLELRTKILHPYKKVCKQVYTSQDISQHISMT